MTAPKKIITVFGATGNQGSGVVNTVLAVPALKAKYNLRAVTRDPGSTKAQALAHRGVEVVKGDLNNVPSLKEATRDAYGVFGVTDFWSIHSKELEIQHGKNIFEACKAEGVAHFVFSSLPHATKSTGGVLQHLAHFDSKAEVEEYIEANKGDMVTSYILPGMFLSFIPNLVRKENGSPLLTLPFPSDSIAWPFIDPPQDGGKYVLGLFERGRAANGARVQAVSCWTTPRALVEALSTESGCTVGLRTLAPQVFAREFPENITAELTETLQIVGEYSVFGKGEEKNQAKHDEWLVEGAGKTFELEEWIHKNGPWKFETTSFLDTLAEQKRNQQNGNSN